MTVKALSKGAQTRERILELAEASVLKNGFAATAIDDLISAAGITKSGFFYHFRDKHDLAKALLERFKKQDDAILDELFARAESLIDDPLHAYLAGLKLFAEVMGDLPETHPGCLVASYCYQEQMFSEDIRRMSADTALAWRKRFRAHLDKIAARYRPRFEVDLDALADMASVLVEGGIILSKVLKDPQALPRQILLHRQSVALAFQAAP